MSWFNKKKEIAAVMICLLTMSSCHKKIDPYINKKHRPKVDATSDKTQAILSKNYKPQSNVVDIYALIKHNCTDNKLRHIGNNMAKMKVQIKVFGKNIIKHTEPTQIVNGQVSLILDLQHILSEESNNELIYPEDINSLSINKVVLLPREMDISSCIEEIQFR